MPKIDAGLNGVEGRHAGEPVPAGLYKVEVVEKEDTQTRSEKPMVKIRLKIFDNEDEKLNGRLLFDQLVISDNPTAKEFLRGTLDALGVPVDSSGAFDSDDLIGTQAVAKVTQKEYEGRMTNNIDDYQPLPGGGASSDAVVR